MLDAIEAGRVINCAGPGADYDRISDPAGALPAAATAWSAPTRCASASTSPPTAPCCDRDGAISRRLFAVGPVTKGAFWEMTAVPDIRRQTEKLAEYMAGLVKAAPSLSLRDFPAAHLAPAYTERRGQISH